MCISELENATDTYAVAVNKKEQIVENIARKLSKVRLCALEDGVSCAT